MQGNRIVQLKGLSRLAASAANTPTVVVLVLRTSQVKLDEKTNDTSQSAQTHLGPEFGEQR